VIPADELAAIAAALSMLQARDVTPRCFPEERLDGSRWKRAAREPELEIEDYRSVR